MRKSLLSISLSFLLFASCSDDDSDINSDPNGGDSTPPDDEQVIESSTAENIPAPSTGSPGQPAGPFTLYDLDTGTITTRDEDWDIAFRATTIAINGGVETGTGDEPARTADAATTITDGTFSSVTTADGLNLEQDTDGAFAIPTGSGNGWYNYNPQVNTIQPIPGKVIVVRTSEGNYAKIEILSYYEDAPNDVDPIEDNSRFYTFNYVINTSGGTSLEQ